MDILFKAEYPATRLPALDGVEAACCQCEGDRDEQQDDCGLFMACGAMLAVVADGMGALARGGAAARLAVAQAGREAGELLREGETYDTMKAALESINGEVYRQIDNHGVMGMSGTTLCAAAIRRDSARFFWCGDSRAYRWRDGKLTRLTEDHVYASYLREMVAEGVMSEADARSHPKRSHLTGYIGMRALEDYSIMAGPIEMKKGDGLLLCTDGLYKCLNEGELRRCMGGRSTFASAQTLIGLVARKRLKGQDNATALVIKWI